MDKNDHGKVTTSLEAAIKQNPMYFKRVGDGYALTPDGLKEYKEMSEDLFLYETEFGKSDDSLYSMYGEQEMVDLFEALEACYEANPLDSVGLDSSSAVPQGTISDDELRSFIHEEEKAWALREELAHLMHYPDAMSMIYDIRGCENDPMMSIPFMA